jgi:predicted methyltransferase
MRIGIVGMGIGLALMAACAADAKPQRPDAFAAAVADPSRPAADTARDAERKPAEMLAFAGVKPGMRVFELVPGGGYFTRLLSTAVGPAGRVFAYVPEESVAAPYKPLDSVAAIAAGHPNVQAVHYPLMAEPDAALAGTIDLAWTSLNYHDFHNRPDFDATAFNRRVFALLKPGGVYVIIDHAALPGAPIETTHTLHRIDKARVVKEVEAAGFALDRESQALANPADPHDARVTDPVIRGHTDQFALRFRKPG